MRKLVTYKILLGWLCLLLLNSQYRCFGDGELTCGRAVAEIFVRSQNLEFISAATDSKRELTLAEVAQIVERHGVKVEGIRTDSDIKKVQPLLQSVSGPIIGHCVLGDDSQKGHYVCLFSRGKSFLICDPNRSVPFEVESLAGSGLKFTGNWLIQAGRITGTGLGVYVCAGALFILVAAVLILDSKRNRKITLGTKTKMSFVLCCLIMFAVGCDGATSITTSQDVSATGPEIDKSVKVAQQLDRPLANNLFSLDAPSNHLEFQVENRADDRLTISAMSLLDTPIDSSQIELTQKCCTFFTITAITPAQVPPRSPFKIELAVKPTVTAFGNSLQRVGFEYLTETGTFLTECVLDVTLPKSKNELIGLTEVDIGFVTHDKFPVSKLLELKLRTQDSHFVPDLLKPEIAIPNARIILKPDEAAETSTIWDKIVPAQVVVDGNLPSGRFSYELPVIYDSEPVGIVKVKGQIVETWSINGKSEIGIAVTKGKCFPDSFKIINADKATFEIQSCSLRQSPGISTVTNPGSPDIRFVFMDSAAVDTRNEMDVIDLVLLVDGMTVTKEFPIRIMRMQ